MNKRVYFFLLFLAVGAGLLAQPYPSPRQRINIDTDWKFAFGHAGNPARDFNYGIANIFSKTGKAEDTPMSSKFNDASWKAVNLPHDWAVELPFVNEDNFDVMAHGYKPVGGLFPETSIGWYRKELSITKADSGQHIAVTFDGVFRDASVWINGFYLGTNESGYTGVTYDLTNYVNFDGKNTLVVQVDATQYEGWFYEGAGIYRHVWLEKYSNVHVANEGGLFVYTKVEGAKAKVLAEVMLENEALKPSTAQVSVVISDRKGNKLAQSDLQRVYMDLNESITSVFEIELTNPILWSLENPYLYRVKVLVEADGKPIDQVEQRLGVRTIEISPEKGVLLNGKMVKIQGVNCHQDHAGVGSALPDYLQYYRIKLLKELGVTAYRTSHNPPTPELLEACDSLGMLVMDETRLLNTSPEYMDQFEKLIKRDRNHPSVYMWSIGNEEGWVQKTSVGKRLALTMLATQKVLDPTRTSTYAADLANHFPGINEVIPVRGFNYREKGMVPYHQDHPGQPVVGTEMGSTVTTRGIYELDSVRAYVPDQDITHPWWASLAEDWWPIAAENDWLMGGFVWTGFDYRGEPTPFEWPNINSHFGIMDVCGFPKNIYYYYQSWWRSDLDVLHISPHWNWEGKEGQPIEVWVNSNADRVELFLNGKSLGMKPMPRNSHLNWSVPYQSGTLKAFGYKGDRKFETEVTTTSEPVKLKIIADRTNLKANGDIGVFTVVALDKKGNEVPTANNLINFMLSDGSTILGVGNGDPSSHEEDKATARSLFSGKCQMILKTDTIPGKLVIAATGKGLKPATLVIMKN